MKEKILPFIIGVLVGAIISTVGWLIYAKVNSNSSFENQMGQMQRPDDMSGDNMQGGNMSEPPSKPDGNNNSTEPPAKPDEVSTNTNS